MEMGSPTHEFLMGTGQELQKLKRHVSSRQRYSASRNVPYEYTWTHAKESVCYNGKILVLTEMLAGRGQVKYGAMPEVIRKNEVGLRAVTSSGYIGTPPACLMSQAKKVNTLEHASKMYGDYTNCMQRLPFRKRNSR